MALEKINPTQTQAWGKLKNHFAKIKTATMPSMFEANPNRAQDFTVRSNSMLLDYSKNIIDAETMTLLRELTGEVKLKEAIAQYFDGGIINQTENRAVLHTALRSAKDNGILIDGENIFTKISEVKQKISAFSDAVISGLRVGYTGKPFDTVVNIGIGGSDLGPAMVVEALKFYSNHLDVKFVSNVDGDHVNEVLKTLNPETTLFVIVSKTFTTQETLSNSETIRKWFLKSAKHDDVAKHFVAVSTNIDKVTAFGIAESNIFPMWDWVGGRFSLWSAVGLTISLSVGYNNFEKLLAGANEMDAHFRETEFESNIPVILAQLSIWYNNFFESESEAIIPYTQYLHKLAPYLQQGIMESNGKSIGRDGKRVNYQTGTIIWGEPGTNSQHAFFQLIHQGTKLIPTDFIGFVHSLHGNQDHHDKLMSNFFAQTEALLNGKNASAVIEELHGAAMADSQKADLVPFKVFEGNKPTNTLLIDKLTPETLGSLIALYEHKIFVQGIIWNIYSYDQWGVELGKQLANSILEEITTGKSAGHDSSTDSLLKYYIEHKSKP